jgi:hypothetical protein
LTRWQTKNPGETPGLLPRHVTGELLNATKLKALSARPQLAF